MQFTAGESRRVCHLCVNPFPTTGITPCSGDPTPPYPATTHLNSPQMGTYMTAWYNLLTDELIF